MEEQMKERIYFDLGKENEELKQKIGLLVEKANQKNKGDKVTLSTLIKFSLSLLKENHIEEIQKATLTDWDLINLEFEKYKEKSSEKISLSEYLIKRLKIQ